jgi:hypothetical protein
MAPKESTTNLGVLDCRDASWCEGAAQFETRNGTLMLGFYTIDHGSVTFAQPLLPATIPIVTLAELANEWWRDRLDPEWRPHSREQNQRILDRLGLTGEFWRLG